MLTCLLEILDLELFYTKVTRLHIDLELNFLELSLMESLVCSREPNTDLELNSDF